MRILDLFLVGDHTLANGGKAVRIVLGLAIIVVTALIYFLVFPGPPESHHHLVAYLACVIIGVIVILSSWMPEKA